MAHEALAQPWDALVYTVPCMSLAEKIGLIAGNGTFPFLVLDAARAQGYEVVVAAIKEETIPGD